jgi:hypothetical protein
MTDQVGHSQELGPCPSRLGPAPSGASMKELAAARAQSPRDAPASFLFIKGDDRDATHLKDAAAADGTPIVTFDATKEAALNVILAPADFESLTPAVIPSAPNPHDCQLSSHCVAVVMQLRHNIKDLCRISDLSESPPRATQTREDTLTPLQTAEPAPTQEDRPPVTEEEPVGPTTYQGRRVRCCDYDAPTVWTPSSRDAYGVLGWTCDTCKSTSANKPWWHCNKSQVDSRPLGRPPDAV